MGNGDILCPSSNEKNGWCVHFERTSDNGKTWHTTDPLSDGKKIGAIQPSILFLDSKHLRAIGRTRQGKLFTVDSVDAGNTWEPMTLIELPNPNSGTDAVTLQDGRHLLVYNHTSQGRYPLNVAISKDAQSWQPLLTLEDNPGEFSYPAVIQSSDGKVHIAYTWNRQRIKYLTLSP